MKKLITLLAVISYIQFMFAAPINIPLGANAYLTKNVEGAKVTEAGITNWTDKDTEISTWFHLNKTGKMNISLRAKSFNENTKITVKIADKVYPLTLNSKEWTVYPITNNVECKKGHLRIDIQGVNKTTPMFAELSDLIVDGEAIGNSADTAPNYIKDFSYYFGRRGPSVHMKYTLPNEDVEYFYNEVTVPEGDDVIGSYYMANGFGQGYFGMQVNSESERRILFSVWSPFTTDDPNSIPKEDRIIKLRQGEGVHIGEFGNEGSGGQSYLKYPWKAGETYKFLQQVHPDGKGNTIYTAYFYATDENRWRLIASFQRPKTDTWYKGAHSFLENFIPNQGYLVRKVLFGNQWAITNKGKWIELTEGTFTNDATARAKKRVDYKGGLQDEKYFFLQNCGFFDDNTEYMSKFTRKGGNKKPAINFNSLKKIKSID